MRKPMFMTGRANCHSPLRGTPSPTLILSLILSLSLIFSLSACDSGRKVNFDVTESDAEDVLVAEILDVAVDGSDRPDADADNGILDPGWETLADVLADVAEPDADVLDVTVDYGTDGVDDQGHDTGVDHGTDVSADVELDIVDDPGADTGADVAADLGTDTASDSDTGTDTGVDTGVDTGTDTSVGPGLPIRIVAANLTSGNGQSYDPGHGIDILDGLNPDIVLVQEFNYGGNSASDYLDFAQTVAGAQYWAVDDSGFQIPNGVVSRWPITGSGYWDDPNISNRELMWATIDIPGDVDLMAISVHLHTSPSSDQVQAAQVIVSRVKAHRTANPGKYMYVVGGDFNGTSAVSTSGFGTDGVFVVDPPDPVDDDANPNTNSNRSKQYDFVLCDPALCAYQVPVVFPSSTDATSRVYSDGLVFDTRTFTQAVLDKYFSPASTGDSSASNMQHMAVVKDFLIK
ncbi:endonuclease [Myxococcota bacterium]|nr:endonuclease [Myxococcota bacterium]